MTTKEQLHRLVDELADEQVARALFLLRTAATGQPVSYSSRRTPASLGVGDSGRGDFSGRVDDILAEGFGR